MAKRNLQEWFDAYGESHQHPTNKLIHWICVPLIFFSIVLLVASIPFPSSTWPAQLRPFTNWAWVALLPVLLFYFNLSWRMGIGMLVVVAVCLTGLYALENMGFVLWKVGLQLFVGAWIGQFYGHKLEGKKPSFFQDLQFLLIGPAWLLGFVYSSLGLRY